VMASDFVRDGLRNYDGELLPTYFSNGPTFNLSSVSVYLQVLPALLFGPSVFVTRAVSVLVSLVAAVAIGLSLRNVFKIRYCWAGVLLLSIAPAWFYHSRTAFETVEMTSFYAGFIYFYLLYRCRSPRYLYLALVFGAMTFYTYSPGQLIIVATGLLLLVSDLRYHWQNRAVALRGLLLLALLALPYLRFYLGHPAAPFEQLSTRAPYWAEPIPLWEKLGRFASTYASAFRPDYWYLPNDHDLPRHLMKGYGHLLLGTLPFAVVGLLTTLRNLRSPAHRVVIASMLAAPAGSALVGIGITRVLVMILPITLLTALGISKTLTWLENPSQWLGSLKARDRLHKVRFSPALLSLAAFAILGGYNTLMLRDGLVNGPTWYTDYGLGGMQYGAAQIYAAIQDYLEARPGSQIMLSPGWANGADVVARFFLGDPLPVRLGSIEGHMARKLPLDEDMLFIMIPQEYQKVVSSGKFTRVRVEQVLPYPDGQPGFYFVRLNYVDNIDQILAAEHQDRLRLQEQAVDSWGQSLAVRYSYLDLGAIGLLFDGNHRTLARTFEANPFVVEMTLPQPRPARGIAVIVGSIEASVNAQVFSGPGESPREFSIVEKRTVEQPEVVLNFGETIDAWRIVLQVRDLAQQEPAHVHIWEIRLLDPEESD